MNSPVPPSRRCCPAALRSEARGGRLAERWTRRAEEPGRRPLGRSNHACRLVRGPQSGRPVGLLRAQPGGSGDRRRAALALVAAVGTGTVVVIAWTGGLAAITSRCILLASARDELPRVDADLRREVEQPPHHEEQTDDRRETKHERNDSRFVTQASPRPPA